ncbi:MAG: hypothetical protein QM539_10780 [Alphaproteobacteria bacterium]|nr:hypothetical protein [Alphaproteobacteria bacterium]
MIKILVFIFYILIHYNTVIAQTHKQYEFKNISCKQIIDTIKDDFYRWYGIYDTIQNVTNKYYYDSLKSILYPIDTTEKYKMDLLDFYFKLDLHPWIIESDCFYCYVLRNPQQFKDSLLLYIKDVNFDWNYKYMISFLLQNQCSDSLYKLIDLTFQSAKEYNMLKHDNYGYDNNYKINASLLSDLIFQFDFSDFLLTKFPPDKKFLLLLDSIQNYYNNISENNYLDSKLFKDIYTNYKNGVYYKLKKNKKKKIYFYMIKNEPKCD